MATPPRKRSAAVSAQQLPAQQPKAETQATVTARKRTSTVATKEPVTAVVAQIEPAARTSASAGPKPRKAASKAAAPVITATSASAATRHAKFAVGSVVKHRVYPFRGVVFDIDPVFNNTEDWWQAIPEEIRPRKDQPFYHLLAENAETTYVAYVSEQNLLADKTGQPVRHPQVKEMFALDENGQYRARFLQSH
jgi:heat shock protein HspQ